MRKILNHADLAQFTVRENWYRHAINRAVLFTDGVKYVADQAGAYWLLDEIAIIQSHDPRVSAEAFQDFQVWKLKVHTNSSATLTCDDGNGNVIYTKQIEYTDFRRTASRSTSPTARSYYRGSTEVLAPPAIPAGLASI